MRIVSFNGVDFAALGVSSAKFADPSSPGPDRQTDSIPRVGGSPVPGGTLTGLQTLTALFTPDQEQDTESTLTKILGALSLDDPSEKLLIASLFDGTADERFVETDAMVGTWSYWNTNTLAVNFIVTTPGWRAMDQTTFIFTTVSADGNFANVNDTYRDILPNGIVLDWDGVTNRSSSTADIGWKHRLGDGLTITNIGTEPLINQPYQIGPIDHAALVTAGQALSSGNDLRVFCEGTELRRNVIGPNTAACFVWVILPTVAPGQAITLDIVTNNPSAGSPPTLTFSSEPPLPGMDISGEVATLSSYVTPTLTFSGVSWETNQWAGGTLVVIQSGGGSWDQVRRIISSTSNTITVDRGGSLTVVGNTHVLLKSGFAGTGGVASGGTTSRLDDSSQVARTNEYTGAWLEITTGALAGQRRQITSNTATSFSVSPAFGSAIASPMGYRVYQSNGRRMWDVRQPPKTTSHPGLWQANKIQAPPTQINFDAPGSWYRFTYQPSNDAYSQPRYDSFLVGAGDYDHVPVMNIQRARRGKVGSQKEVGIADAIGASSPYPISGVRFGYTLRNAKKAGVAEGMCEARFMTQESGGELWSTFLSDVTVHNSTATIAAAWYDLTSYGNPNRIAMTLVPNGSDEIPSADSNTAQLRSSGDYVALAVNPAAAITESIDWFTAPPATVAVYDVHLLLRTGIAAGNPPYHQIVIGGPDRRIFLGAADQIAVDCEAMRAVLQDGISADIIRSLAYAVQAQYVFDDPNGDPLTVVAPRWLPIPPNTSSSTPIFYTDPSGAGWGAFLLSVVGYGGYYT